MEEKEEAKGRRIEVRKLGKEKIRKDRKEGSEDWRREYRVG